MGRASIAFFLHITLHYITLHYITLLIASHCIINITLLLNRTILQYQHHITSLVLHYHKHYIIISITLNYKHHFTRAKHYEQRVKEINGINIGKWLLAHWRTMSGTPTPSNWDMYKVNISEYQGECLDWQSCPGVGGARRIIFIDHVCN